MSRVQPNVPSQNCDWSLEMSGVACGVAGVSWFGVVCFGNPC